MTNRKPITRRDFLNGTAVAVTAAGLAPHGWAQSLVGGTASFRDDTYYPPSLTGMRGNHPGAFDAAHALAWNDNAPSMFRDTGEDYDLVVIGGGLSGLAAALFFQQERGPDQRILILDNHDDFGGHAKRNEFNVAGRMLLGVGGSINLEAPKNYSRTAKALLKDLGIDMTKLEAANDPTYIMSGGGRNTGYYVKTSRGESRMITGRWMGALRGKTDPAPFIEQLPYTKEDKAALLKLVGGEWDFLVGLSVSERADYLSSHSYYEFLTDKVGLSEEALSFADPILRPNYGVGGDGLSVSEALFGGAPGLRAVGWPWAWGERLFYNEDRPFHALVFPDGNASVARLMVRRLIPDVAPGTTMDDIVNARFDYSKLDAEGSPVRIRLNSTAVRVQQEGESVSVSYAVDGRAHRVRAKHCILACYNAIIPHLLPELPDEQRDALKYGSKVPLIWTNVALRDGSPFHRAGSDIFLCPNSFFQFVTKAPPTKMDGYQAPQDPADPLVVFMWHMPVPRKQEGQTARDLFRLARYELLETPFSKFEEEVKAQLTDMYGEYGFVADRDIEAITVNRWSHGYAYIYLDLDDPKFKDGQHPHEIGRKQFGRISIANTDSEARAYLDAAIDAAWRAVEEQLSL